MSRWEPGARVRLEQAALALFLEQGFAATTVPQITARAGLTTRTFFRHFADKREVLFAGDEELPALVARLMAEAPASLGPMALIAGGLETVAATRFEGQREYLLRRRAVVEADEGLRERELRKSSMLSEAIGRGFLERGVDAVAAALAAQVAVSVLDLALRRWLDQDDGRPLASVIRDTVHTLRVVTSEPIEPSLPTPSRSTHVPG